MREILFRGKRKDNGNPWIYGHLHKMDGYGTGYTEYGIQVQDIPTSRPWSILVIPETVGQYTGITDKNGKKIFEGDICRNTMTDEIVSVQWHGTMAGYVWSKRRENNKYLFNFGELFRAHDKYEIIGNIHDNPELLKGGE